MSSSGKPSSSASGAPPTKKARTLLSYFKPKSGTTFDMNDLDTQIISVERANNVLTTVNQTILVQARNESKEEKKTYCLTGRKDRIPIIKWQIDLKASAEKAKAHFHLDNGVSSIRRWRQEFEQILSGIRSRHPNIDRSQQWDLAVSAYIKEVKKGRPTILTEKDQNALITMMKRVRNSDGKITPLIVIALGYGIMRTSESDYEGIELSVGWARALLKSLNWTKRKVTTDRKLDLEELSSAVNEAKDLDNFMGKYHPALVMEMDETLSPWCPLDDSTYAPKGEKRIAIQGYNDKRGNTATITITRSGKLLPFQLIWSGKTSRSFPKCKWPDGFVNCFSGPSSKGNKKGTKWQNAKTIGEYLNGIVIPYVQKTRKDEAIILESDNYEQKLGALLVMDHHWSHLLPDVEQTLQSFAIVVRFIPKKATDLFSVLDVAINRPYKAHLRNQYSEMITQDIQKQMKDGISPENVKVDLRASRVKPKCGSWIISAYMNLQKDAETIISNGFKKVTKNIEAALIKVNKKDEVLAAKSPTRDEIKAEFAKNPERIWLVKDIGKCRIEKFEGSVHCYDLLDNQVCIVMTEILKSSVPLPFPNEHIESFDKAMGTFIMVEDSWLSLEVDAANTEGDECDDEDDGEYDEEPLENDVLTMLENHAVKYCICQQSEQDLHKPSSPMLECDYCGEAFHWICVRPSPDAQMPKEEDEWFCPTCVEILEKN
jgi:hypothetical protein